MSDAPPSDLDAAELRELVNAIPDSIPFGAPEMWCGLVASAAELKRRIPALLDKLDAAAEAQIGELQDVEQCCDRLRQERNAMEAERDAANARTDAAEKERDTLRAGAGARRAQPASIEQVTAETCAEIRAAFRPSPAPTDAGESDAAQSAKDMGFAFAEAAGDPIGWQNCVITLQRIFEAHADALARATTKPDAPKCTCGAETELGEQHREYCDTQRKPAAEPVALEVTEEAIQAAYTAIANSGAGATKKDATIGLTAAFAVASTLDEAAVRADERERCADEIQRRLQAICRGDLACNDYGKGRRTGLADAERMIRALATKEETRS